MSKICQSEDDEGTNSTGNSALQATTGVRLSSGFTVRLVQSWYSNGGLDILGMVVVECKF